MSSTELSIVLPAYREGDHLADTLRVVDRVARSLVAGYEIIVVDDGSHDNTWHILNRLREELPELRGLSLARNFGKEAAILAGLEASTGDAVVVMDSDLQHPPSLIPQMMVRWRAGAKIVNAVKADRGGEGRLHRFGAGLFYKTFERIGALPLADSSDFKLLDREVVDVYCGLREQNTFFRGLVSWMGYPQAEVLFQVEERAAGRSGWSWFKLTRMGVRAIASFSTAPLHVVTAVGALFMLFAVGLGLQTLVVFMRGEAVAGFTTAILLLLFVSALQMISLGIIGQYVAQIYDEVKRRPRYLVQDRFPESVPSEQRDGGAGRSPRGVAL